MPRTNTKTTKKRTKKEPSVTQYPLENRFSMDFRSLFSTSWGRFSLFLCIFILMIALFLLLSGNRLESFLFMTGIACLFLLLGFLLYVALLYHRTEKREK